MEVVPRKQVARVRGKSKERTSWLRIRKINLFMKSARDSDKARISRVYVCRDRLLLVVRENDRQNKLRRTRGISAREQTRSSLAAQHQAINRIKNQEMHREECSHAIAYDCKTCHSIQPSATLVSKVVCNDL